MLLRPVSWFLIGLLGIVASASAHAACALVRGDLDADAEIRVLDVQCGLLVAQVEMLQAICPVPIVPVPSCLLADAPGPDSETNSLGPHDVADMNCDQLVNVSDILLLVQGSFGGPPALASPVPSGCPALCEASEVCGDGVCGPDEGPDSCGLDCPGTVEIPIFEVSGGDPLPACCEAQNYGDGMPSGFVLCGPFFCSGLPEGCDLLFFGDPDAPPGLTAEACASAATASCSQCDGNNPNMGGGDSAPCCGTPSQPVAGCDDSFCEDCVCGAEPYCCDTSWDELCAASAFSLPFVGAAPCNSHCKCEPLTCAEVLDCILNCADESCREGCVEEAAPGESAPVEACAGGKLCAGAGNPPLSPDCILANCPDANAICP